MLPFLSCGSVMLHDTEFLLGWTATTRTYCKTRCTVISCFSVRTLLLRRQTAVNVVSDALYANAGFGFGTEFTHWPEEWKDLEIFNLLKKHLLAGGDYSESSAQFQRDVEQFAFGRGTDDSMAFATSRLSALDDAWESSIESSKQDNDNASNLKPSAILASLLRFDPTERPTMFEVLRSSLFECTSCAIPHFCECQSTLVRRLTCVCVRACSNCDNRLAL